MKLAVILLLFFTFVVLCSCTAVEPKQKKHENKGVEEHGTLKKGKKYNSVKHMKKSGKKSNYDEEKAAKGKHTKVTHVIDDEEDKGKKKSYFNDGEHHVYKKQGGGSAHGASYNEGAHQKKTRYTKGFREKYHKNEHKKHDSFYSKGYKSGDYEIFSSKGGKYGSHLFKKEDIDKQNVKKALEKHIKNGKKAGAHNQHDVSGYRDEQGHKSHYNKNTKWGKKNPKSFKAKKYHYASTD